jgi:hypothetical protein
MLKKKKSLFPVSVRQESKVVWQSTPHACFVTRRHLLLSLPAERTVSRLFAGHELSGPQFLERGFLDHL